MSSGPQTQPPAPATYDGGSAPAVVGAPEPAVLFSVTKGNPTAEEIAALVAVLAAARPARGQAPAEGAPTRRERIRRATLRPRHMMNQRRGRL